jgi:hypothetical protein
MKTTQIHTNKSKVEEYKIMKQLMWHSLHKVLHQ